MPGARTIARLAMALCLVGCQGKVLLAPGDRAGPSGSDDGPITCDAPHVDAAPLTHLTRAEYARTVRDLLGVDASVAEGFAPDEDTVGFEVGTHVSPLLAEQYVDAAEALAERAVTERLDALLPCDPSGEEACAREFIDAFGARAYRRPLTPDEADAFLALFRVGRAYDFATGIEVVIAGALSSPSFLYHVELDPEDARAGDVVAVDDVAMASRLSYFLWSSMPDDALLASAAAGELHTPDQLETEARRMLADPRARDGVRNFTRQWLGLDRLVGFHRDPTFYPDVTDSTGGSLRASIEAFLDEVYFGDQPSIDTLLLGEFAFFDESLASLYDVPGVSGSELVRVELDPARRAGLLTQPALLAILSKPNQSDPIHRGLFVRQRLLCQQLPPPPPDVMAVAPDPEPGLSTRERFAQHSTDTRCRGCHQLMEPIGFGFEHYDALGRWRDEDEGMPIDATGELNATLDADGSFDGVPELAARLAASDQVKQCVAIQWFRYAVGRTETSQDTCSVEALQEDFRTSGYDLRELLVAIVRTDAFRNRLVPDGENP